MRISSVALLLTAGAVLLSGQTSDETRSAESQAWQLSAQARELARSPEPSKALPLYERAIELAPTAAEIRLDYAVALGWSGRYSEAVRLYRVIRQQEPVTPPWAQLEMANAELFGGSADQAFELFDALVVDGDRREPILTRRALALRRSGRRDEAARAYREALGYYPDSETAALGIIECFLDRRRVADAHTFIATWSQGRARSAQILAWRAWLLSRLGRHSEAQELTDSIPGEAFMDHAILVGRTLHERFRSERFAITEPPPPQEGALQPVASTLPLDLPGVETGKPLTRQAEQLAEEGVILAREGSTQLGAAYLRRAVAMSPTHHGIRRDLAVVLTWAEQYVKARRQFDHVFREEPIQPVWSRSDRIQAELFGGEPDTALTMINELLAEGNVDEHNLLRKGLALRWSGNPKAAEKLYKQISALYPDSSSSYDGLIHSLADQNRLGSAIKAANQSLAQLPDHWGLMKSKAQVLNWAGRHLNAEKTLASLPEDHSTNSDVLHHQALAARWSDDARSATEYARAFVQRYPGDREAYRLKEDLAYQYGYVLRTRASYFGDTLDYVSHGVEQEIEAPLSLSHRINAGVNRQYFSEGGDSARWTTYALGWTGQVSRRLTAHASAGQVLYSGDGIGTRLSLDASASLLVSDRVRLRGGAGQAPTTAFRAVQRRVQTQYGYVEADLRPTLKTQVSGRYGITGFSGDTTRTGIDLSVFRRVLNSRRLRLRLGTRNGWILHDRFSEDVYSPDAASSHLGAVHLEGALPWSLDYVAEFGSGLQYETGSPRSVPFTSTIEFAKPLTREVWLRLKGGYSNSAIDRLNSGGRSYRMSYASVQLDYRLKREF